jgi:hypothetical protein
MHDETQAGGDPPDEGCVICPDYNLDGRSSWWEWTIDGALYAGDFLLGGPTGESLLAKSALMGIFKGAGVKRLGNILKPLGRGSTGRTVANNLTEQLAMKEIISNPSALGKAIPKMKPLSDPRWKGWIKMSNKNAHGVEIHFNAQFKNGKIINVDDFKFIGQ